MDPLQHLIERFYKALDLRQIDTCEALLSDINQLAQSTPKVDQAAHWFQYLSTVLIDVRDNDWGRAEYIYDELLANDQIAPYLRGHVLLALGVSYSRQARWVDSIESYTSALNIFNKIDEKFEKAKALNQLALAYQKGFTVGDLDVEALTQAEHHCLSALDELTVIEQTDEVVTHHAKVCNALGSIYRSLDQLDQALDSYQQMLESCNSLDNQFGVGLAHSRFGEIHHQLGTEHWPQAQAAFKNALSIFLDNESHYEALDVLADLGLLHAEMGQYGAAIDYYAMAIGIIESLRSGISSEAARTGFFTTVAHTYAHMILTCVKAEEYAQAFEYMELARSRTFLDLLAADSLQVVNEDIAETVTLSEMQAELPHDVILLEYYTTGLIEASDRSNTIARDFDRHRFPPQKTLIFAITHTDMQVFEVGVSPNALYPSRRDAVIEDYFLPEQMRRTLYSFLLKPAEALLEGKRRIYLVPHGPLHYVPFQALLADDQETLLRIDGPQLIYAPSATVLLRDVSPRDDTSSASQQSAGQKERRKLSCLAVGYNGGTKNPLLFAEEEATSIAKLMNGKAITGDAIKKWDVLAHATGCNWLHFSCHGSFDPDKPLASALTLSETETLTAQEVLDKLTLQCDLVSLSACESGLSQVRRGDELYGLVRAFIYAGTRTMVVTQWKVEELSTRIVMERFCRNILSGMDYAEALTDAQLYLRMLTRDDLFDLLKEMNAQSAEEPFAQESFALKGDQDLQDSAFVKMLSSAKPDALIFSNPYYWAPFILIGNRNRVA